MTAVLRPSRDVIARTEPWQAACRFYSAVLGLRIAHEDDSIDRNDTGASRLYVEEGPAGAVIGDLVRAGRQALGR